ncbi:MAG: hypothetical protein JST86_13755 [Bacteroidetes bacterium]|nr:hypothetical protein [Bacteroidota bacterium]
MKKVFTFLIVTVVGLSAKAQDSAQVKGIDEAVSKINQLSLPIIADSLNQQYSGTDTKITTYTTKVRDANQLYKYTSRVVTHRVDHGVTTNMENSSTFYFSNNKLVKVEEYTINGNRRDDMSWYYANNLPVYWTLNAAKSADRAKLLVTQADDILRKYIH